MTAGRPRERDREQIAKELSEWAQLETSINLCGFFGPRFLDADKLSLYARECEEFRRVFNGVKMIIGQRREQMVNAKLLDSSAYNRNAHTYDYFMRQEHRDDLEFRSKLDQETGKVIPEIIGNKFDKMIDQMSSMQETSKKARKVNKREE